MLENCPQDAIQALGADGVEQIRQQTVELYPRYERMSNRILRNFVQYLKIYKSGVPMPQAVATDNSNRSI
jgi:hypothetical protein